MVRGVPKGVNGSSLSEIIYLGLNIHVNPRKSNIKYNLKL